MNTEAIPVERRLWGTREGVKWVRMLGSRSFAALAGDAHEITPQVRDLDPRQMRAQLGTYAVWAISGGRIAGIGRVAYLPVVSGWVVAIHLAANDTYTVRRLRVRADRLDVHGVVENVYCDRLGDVAIQAASFDSHKFGGDAS